MQKFDVAIVGGGPGGYVAAIRAAKQGLNVALVEGRDLGGTCLNRGCIPSKTLLKHAEVLDQIKNAQAFGITVNDVSYSIEAMVKRKNTVVNTLKNGIKGLLKQNKIKVFEGYGVVSENKTIIISLANENTTILAENIILATGSKPFVPPLPGLDEVSYHTSDTIFDIEEVPSKLVIVGGGVIGLEIGCIFNRLGTEVEVVEMAESIIPNEDEDATKFLTKQLKKSGISIHTGTKITGFKPNNGKTIVEMEKNSKKQMIETDNVLVAVGREPNVTGIEDLPIAFEGKFVDINQSMETSISGIYAIGDLVGGYQLAHAASEEGIRAVKHIVGQEVHGEAIIPRCVYSFPEIASVGLTETEAKKAGYQVKVKKVDLAANGKAITANENNGFMKIIADEKYGEILGVVMVGAHVTEMISAGTAFMHLEGTVEEIESMVFPHPTVSEALFETAAAWMGNGIHYN
ncbi:dihydrolipoyl dehydrogenase [Oceanobacillus profundus]|uniref:Dihydrolipoyl dehydrogenase n=1 Tax=Oceanobacillus profundus TaxID=372463 RepID=A0A417YP18_9BACI|nr:dihydrolipoyl dehydrogenase [Oceanobacillus profundus]PAE30443.1 dihydrolipoyl dehydrogenase [Paenibacillus sp. 7884-2]RHW35572.1 dihydrolipoyl dehydrogenase [Oceanobacillus profundus]